MGDICVPLLEIRWTVATFSRNWRSTSDSEDGRIRQFVTCWLARCCLSPFAYCNVHAATYAVYLQISAGPL